MRFLVGRKRPLQGVMAAIGALVTFTLLQLLTPSASAMSLKEQHIEVGGNRYQVSLPEGYTLEVLDDSLSEPRMLAFDGAGNLFIGSRDDRVYRLAPPYKEHSTFVKLSGYPHSVSFRKGEILIARVEGLYRAPYTPGQKKISRRKVKLLAALPGGRGHDSRTVRVGPDGRIYLSLGISGNCSDQYLGKGYPFQQRRGGILRLREGNGKPEWETFASGLRNPVDFDWHPGTGVMYGANNGPDHLGFDLPPEYFSRLAEGSFHGMPWFQFDGERILRDTCVESPPPRPLDEVSPPVATFPSRNAPLGVAFVPRGALEDSLFGNAVVALHGSWGTAPKGSWMGDRTTRRHPALVMVTFENGEARGVEEMVTGFQLPDGDRWARPAGVAFGPDGALYFTSDEGTEGLFRLRRR